MRTVYELPPSDSLSILVSLESLKGMWFDLSASLLTTLVSAKRLLLM